MENKKEISGKIYRFGIMIDMEGNIMIPTIDIEGVLVAKATLADWIWQGIKYMKDELDNSQDKERNFFLKRCIKDAITIHDKLIGQSDDSIESTIADWLK